MRLLNYVGRAVLDTIEGYMDVVKARGGTFGPDPQALFPVWSEFLDWASSAHRSRADMTKIGYRALRSPVPAPGQVFAIGLNYFSHAQETGLTSTAGRPLTFTKFPGSIAAPHGEVALSGPEVDWEVELVAVIGRSAYCVAPEDAWAHVAGLTVGQDFSDRSVQMEGATPQFSLGKSFASYGPLGPALATLDSLDDRDDLRLRCTVNRETVQDSRTSQMIHSVAGLVSLLSEICPLGPGDIVFTGTPDGVGMGRHPARSPCPGDTVVSSIEGIGSMEHLCVSGREGRGRGGKLQ